MVKKNATRNPWVMAAGKLAAFVVDLWAEMQERNLPEEAFDYLVSKAMVKKIADFLTEQFRKAGDIFIAVVDYGRSLVDKNAALHKLRGFTYINDGIVNYPLDQDLSVGPATQSGKKKLRFKLVRFDGKASFEERRDGLKKMGLRPALPTEGDDFLLDDQCFEEVEVLRQKESDKNIWIAMLSSVFVGPRGGRGVACFDLDDADRRLGLGWLGFGWYGFWFFLAVCED